MFRIANNLNYGILARMAGYLAIISVLVFLRKLYQVRTRVRRAGNSEGVFLVPHSFLFGHLITIAKIHIKNKIPADSHGQYVPLWLAREYPEVMKAGAVYIDAWPIAMPLLAVFHPEMMAQFTQENSQVKHWQLRKMNMPFSGCTDLVCSEGEWWKAARNMYNPGFSTKNLISMVPDFVEEALVFRERLRNTSEKGEVVKLMKFTVGLSVDVIGRAVLGTRLHAQSQSVPLMEAMMKQLSMMSFDLNLRKSLDPLKHFWHWKYNRVFRNEVMPYIQDTVRDLERIEGPKTIVTLALRSHVAEMQDVSAKETLPPDFLQRVISDVKIFMFAGHDTTATVMAYVFYELSRNPEKAAILRAEHDTVFGTVASEAAARISANPTLLNQLPYTLAVLKETLRLWPPIGTVRIGAKNFTLRNPDTGVVFPAEDFCLFGTSTTSQRLPNYWPSPESFIPERFMTRDENDPLHPLKNAFRSFEMGPRNCIGQELVSLELRIVLALTVREFDMETAYNIKGAEVEGTKAYQVAIPRYLTAQPKDGMPMRIRRRKL